MKLSFLFAGAAAATAPVISLDLSEQGILKRKYYANKAHPRFNNPRPQERPAFAVRASFGVCTAGDPRNAKECKLPVAKAYDHHDGKLTKVTTTTHLVNLNGKGVGKCQGKNHQEKINWNRRSEYIIKYNAVDRAGNKADEIYFSLVLDDPTPPVLKTPGDTTIQACYNLNNKYSGKLSKGNKDLNGNGNFYTLPRGSAWDNIDHAVAVGHSRSRKFNTKNLGTYKITYKTSDKASCYGKNRESNKVSKTLTIKVVDTQKPWLVIKGKDVVKTECAKNYKDGGAICYDRHDSTVGDNKPLSKTALKAKITNPNRTAKSPANFHVRYDCKDMQGLKAVMKNRKVQVIDTTKPTLKISHIKNVHNIRGQYKGLTEKSFDKKSLFSEYMDDHVIHHATGFKLDTKYLDRLDEEGYGYTCSDSCSAPTKPKTTTKWSKCAKYTCVPEKKNGIIVNKCKTLKCKSGWKAAKYDNTEPGAYRLAYACTDHAGNTAKKHRMVFNEDKSSLADITINFGFTCPTLDKFMNALVSVVQDFGSKNDPTGTWQHFSTENVETILFNGKPYNDRRLIESAKKQTAKLKLIVKDLKAIRRLVAFLRSLRFKNLLDAACTCKSYPGPPTVTTTSEFLPVIVIKGGDTKTVEATTTGKYIDAGATCSDKQDGIICAPTDKWGNENKCIRKDYVKIAKVSNPKTPYEVTFDCFDAQKNEAIQTVRYVSVVDTTKPTCKAVSSGTHEAGFAYTDKGTTCQDNIDGAITKDCAALKVKRSCMWTRGVDSVNVKVPGKYTISYQAIDKSGNVGAKTYRYVTVVDTLKPVIALKYKAGGNYFHVGDSSDTGKLHDGTVVKNPAGDYFK